MRVGADLLTDSPSRAPCLGDVPAGQARVGGTSLPMHGYDGVMTVSDHSHVSLISMITSIWIWMMKSRS